MTKKKELLIVESPTKARTIARLLGQRMKVMSSMGHISDLPKSRLGVDIEHGFEPQYIRIRGKGPAIKELQKAAKDASVVYLGCDPDREGEAIAYSVANEIVGGTRRDKGTKGQGPSPKVKRVLLYEITRPGIEQAFAAPGEVDMDKVNSHRGRRVLDRLVGYLVSPLLWRIVKTGLSAGRVQTVALRMIVEREREIQGFKPEEYWVVKAVFVTTGGENFQTQLVRIDGKTAKLAAREQVEKVERECRQAEFRVGYVESREKSRSPLPPFTTASLQQDAAQRLGLAPRRTMQLAQQLFEGIELAGGEAAGLVTYPRTDSVRVAEGFLAETREFIAGTMEPEYLPERPRAYKDKRGAQGAHEAIRPTRIGRTPESAREDLNRDQFRLYDLIYRRYLASQLADARYGVTEATVKGGRYEFWAEAVECRFPGYEKVYGDRQKETRLPKLTPGEPVKLSELKPEQKVTQPPSRFTEATLIKKLESNGIGRPSTYATIVSTLFDRHYVERRERKLHPTELGVVVNDVLVPRFANVFEVGFTREMERELDLVEEGKEKWQTVVDRFYQPLKQDLDQVENNVGEIRNGLRKELDEKCPECGKPLAERWGRYGKFIACSDYPNCRYIKKEPATLLDEKCPQCGLPLVERKGRFGPFKACSGYPKCKFIKKEPAQDLKPGDKCPTCGKPLVEKRGRFGTFVACPGYPDCRFMVRGKKPEPKVLDEKCPQCGKNLVERQGRFGKFVACPGYPKCKYIKKEQKAGSRGRGFKGPSGGRFEN